MLRRSAPVFALLALAVLVPSCASSDAEPRADDFSDEAWSNLPAGPEEGTALDADALATEDVTTAETIDADDPPSADDDDDDASYEAPSVADLPIDTAPGELGELVTLGAPKYRNPVLGNCADPGVIRTGGSTPTYYAVCTGGGYPRFSSPDLVHWKADGHIFTPATRPAWATGNFWAPEIHHVGAGFVAYFSALSARRGKMCIGAARAASPEGPFKDIGRPLVCSAHVSLIDAHLYTAASGRHFLYYKTDSNALRPQERTVVYGQEVGADGVSPVGPRRALLQNTLRWEGDVVEGPWVVGHGGFFYMFYSGFRYCNGTYSVGVARSKSPLGPFVKRGNPILRSNAAWSGPGHNSIVSRGGHDYIVYHAWRGKHECGQAGGRAMLLDRVRWVGGWPRINNGTPSRGSLPAP